MRAAFAVSPLRAAAVSTLALCAACTRPAEGPLAGASDAWAKPPDAVQVAAPPAPTWDAYASVLGWAPVNPAPFVSKGHQPAQAVDIRVSPESLSTYSGLVGDSKFADGAILAELSHSGSGHSYGMRKAGGSWAYFELDAQGGVVSSGALTLCAGCHAEAPADGVFGLPRELGETR